MYTVIQTRNGMLGTPVFPGRCMTNGLENFLFRCEKVQDDGCIKLQHSTTIVIVNHERDADWKIFYREGAWGYDTFTMQTLYVRSSSFITKIYLLLLH